MSNYHFPPLTTLPSLAAKVAKRQTLETARGSQRAEKDHLPTVQGTDATAIHE